MDEVSVQNEALINVSQIRPDSTNESLFWHNHKKIYYFDSFVSQNLNCTAYTV